MSTPPILETVRAPKGARILELDWDDGSTSRIRHSHLRGFCPCASCQGHQGPVRFSEASLQLPESAFELADLEEIGSYALRLVWGDGHRSGIFRFDYLHDLGGLETLPEDEVRAKRYAR